MWLSTNKKSKTGKNSSLISNGASGGGDWRTTLPLDWTRMKRDRQGFGDDGAGMGRHRGSTRPRGPSDNNGGSDGDGNSDAGRKIEGRAIFCLHDNDPDWIQGYFVAKGSTKPWGMLVTREEVDDCMACCAGGYRRLSLTVYNRHRKGGAIGRKRKRPGPESSGSEEEDNNENLSGAKREKPLRIRGVEWTGGDMMALYHPDYVDMKGELLLTGKRALPVLHRYFQNLIHRLEKEFCVEECSSVLDWLPDVAIVTGPMSLALPPE